MPHLLFNYLSIFLESYRANLPLNIHQNAPDSHFFNAYCLQSNSTHTLNILAAHTKTTYQRREYIPATPCLREPLGHYVLQFLEKATCKMPPCALKKTYPAHHTQLSASRHCSTSKETWPIHIRKRVPCVLAPRSVNTELSWQASNVQYLLQRLTAVARSHDLIKNVQQHLPTRKQSIV